MKNNLEKLASPLFFLGLLILGLLTYKDYGVSFDEPAQRLIGVTNLNHIAHKFNLTSIINNESLAQFPKKLDQITDRDYGVIFELPAAYMEHAFDLKQERDIYHARHLLTFLFFLAGVFAVYRMAQRRFNDWRIGLLAATFLILSPRIFADAFYNDKDLVFLSVFAIAMNTSIGFLLKPNFKTAFIHGLACAVAIDARLMAVIIPALTVCVLALKVLKKEERLTHTALQMLAFLGTSIVFTVLLWPFLWDAPLDNFIQAFKNMANFRHNHYIIFMGESVRASNLPWYYLPAWIVITTPLIYLGLFIVGSCSVLISLKNNYFRLWTNDNQLQDLIFLALFIGPIVAVILLNSVLYNGWRHLYFVYPAFILICVRGLVLLWDMPKFTFFCRSLLVLVVSIGCLHTSYWMIKYHPLQNVFFNRFAGNWSERFEVDYWGLSNKPALDKIFKKLGPEKTFSAWPGLGNQWPGGWQLPFIQNLKLLNEADLKKIHMVGSSHDAEYVITSAQGNIENNTKSYLNNYRYELFDHVLIDDIPVVSIFKKLSRPIPPHTELNKKIYFSSYQPGLNYLAEGWNSPENWGTWSNSLTTKLTIPLPAQKPSSLSIHFRALIGPKLASQKIIVIVDGQPYATTYANQTLDNLFEVKLPKNLSHAALTVEFILPLAKKPSEIGLDPRDDRVLGIGIEWVEFR
jgi:hypothetical protein